MAPILETRQLNKRYGRIRAVQDLDLKVEKGQVFGILGPNGSGKSTTLGMLLGVVKKTSGTFSWFGQGDHYQLRKRVGAILEHPVFYPFLSAVQNLEITARIKDVQNPDVEGLLQLVGLYARRSDKFRTYSLGMKQRLAIAAALVSDPEVLIFDEPTNGLDPQGIADIRQLILQISAMGKTIVLASHLLDEVQKVCSHFAVLQNGKKIFQGSVEEVLERRNQVEVRATDLAALRQQLEGLQGVRHIEQRNGLLILHGTRYLDTQAINQYLFDRGIVADHLVNVRTNLEEQFLNILKAHHA